MKRLLFLFALLPVLGWGQTKTMILNKIVVKDTLTLKAMKVTSISADAGMVSPSDQVLPTQKAVRDYVNAAVATGRIALRAGKPSPLTTYIADVVIDTVGADSAWVWNASIYRVLLTGGGGGGGTTNLAYVTDGNTGTISNSNGTGVVIPEATDLIAGLLSATKKLQYDAKNSGVQFKDEGSNLGSVGTVTAVDFTGSGVAASRSGNVVTVNVTGGGGGSSAFYKSGFVETRQFQHSTDTTYFVPKTMRLESNPVTAIDFSLFDWASQSAPNVYSPITNNRNLSRDLNSQNLVASSGTHVKNQTGEQGYPSAVRVNIPANNAGLGTYFNWSFLPAGTYTYRFRARSLNNTPSIKVGVFGSESTITPTTSWATYTVTITFATSTSNMSMTLCKPSNSTQDSISMLFDEMMLQKSGEAIDLYDHGTGSFYSGALNATSNNFWKKPFIASPTGRADFLTFGLSSGKDLTGIILFRPRVTLAATGTFPLFEQTGDYLSSLFLFGKNIGGTVYNHLQYNSTLAPSSPVKEGFWNVAAIRRRVDTCDLFLNGVKVSSGLRTGTHAFSRLLFGYVNSSTAGVTNTGDIMMASYYNKALSDAEIHSIHSSYANKFYSSHAGILDTTKVFFFEGDSNTQGDYTSSWAGLFMIQNQPFSQFNSLAVAGTGITGLQSDVKTVVQSTQNASLFGKKVVYAFMTGTNDAKLGSDPSGYYADIVEAIRPIRAAGAYIVALTILPKDPATYASFNAARATYNTFLRAGEGIDFDAVVDLATNSNLETWNTTYYSDFVHINNLGRQIVADLFKAKMNGFLRSIK